MFFEYNANGDLLESKARLSGTLLLDRSHDGGGAVAPAPPEASGGLSTAVDIVTMHYERDAFGNVTRTQAAGGRCRSVTFESDYADLPVAETVYAGDRGETGCGTRLLTTTAQYDRGLALVTSLLGVTGQPTRLDYDGVGRIVAKTFADPANPGQLAPLPAVKYSYTLPVDATMTPYSTVVLQSQDGPSASSGEYLEQHSFVDGLARPLAVLSEGDPAAGDGGDWIVSGVAAYDTKGATLRTYEPFFFTGSPSSFALGPTPATSYSSTQHDAFGRVIALFGLDGETKLRTYYHALSRDVWDAEDLAPGSHQGTYATSATDGHGRLVRSTERIRVSGVIEAREVIREYLPTGELFRITQHRAGSPDTVRWMRYDSLGRLVLNVEPNTSTGFSPDLSTDISTIKAWRYAYNDAGDLVGTSDARGCGVNYHFEAAGRLIAEDYSPCEVGQAAYTQVTNLATGAGAEAFYRYDMPDPEAGSITDAAGHTFPIDASQLAGRVVSVSDRGSKGVIRYDARGRVTGTAVRIANPGGANPADSSSYAPRWYIQDGNLDAADRTVGLSTGATVTELLGSGGQSVTTAAYSHRGTLSSIGSSYGILVASRKFSADGLITSAVFGDLAGTQRGYSYDQLRQLRSVQTYRGSPELWTSINYTPASGKTQQLLLEDYDINHDQVGNIIEIKDWRLPSDWPTGSQPVNRKLEYDDLYRLTRERYDYSAGSDAWTSPFAAENADPTKKPQPSPHVAFSGRVKDQRYSYDHLGNTIRTTDDVSGFFDRSLGSVENGTPTSAPHQLRAASNRTLAPASPRKGDLSASYDAAGNLKKLITRRDGSCLPLSASCWQRFEYDWDELGRLVEARRWDLAPGAERTNHAGLNDAAPSRATDAQLRYVYDAAGQRIVKTAVDFAGAQSHTIYVFSTLELRHTWWTSTDGAPNDYALTSTTESVILPAAGVRGRVVYSELDLPSMSSNHQHVFLELSDHLGSSTSIIDLATGELVEYSTYLAYGGAESDYRPVRWGSFREPYKFSGKEEDVEVGLAYFGARYLVVGLGRWASPDPATIHKFRSDLNPYSYVAGRPLAFVDPDGQELLTAIAIGIAIGAVLAGGTTYYAEAQASGNANPFKMRRESWERIGIAAGIGGFAGGAGAAAGYGVGGAIADPQLGAILGGAAGGAAGAATTYVGTWAAANVFRKQLPSERREFHGGAFMADVTIGAVTGGIAGEAAYRVQVLGTPEFHEHQKFPAGITSTNPEAGAYQAAVETNDWTYIRGREFATVSQPGAGGSVASEYAVGGEFRELPPRQSAGITERRFAAETDISGELYRDGSVDWYFHSHPPPPSVGGLRTLPPGPSPIDRDLFRDTWSQRGPNVRGYVSEGGNLYQVGVYDAAGDPLVARTLFIPRLTSPVAGALGSGGTFRLQRGQ